VRVQVVLSKKSESAFVTSNTKIVHGSVEILLEVRIKVHVLRAIFVIFDSSYQARLTSDILIMLISGKVEVTPDIHQTRQW
jgi:hypothetical protein